jgi:hypothetical protein
MINPIKPSGCVCTTWFNVQLCIVSAGRISVIRMVQVKLSLCVINEVPRHEDVWGSGGITPPFLTSTLDGGE